VSIPILGDQRSFEFSSGGAYHPSGYGEWRIQLESQGQLSIEHNVQGKVTEYGPFRISEQENQELWRLINQCKLENLGSSKLPGIPDEVKYTFSLKDPTGVHQADLWVGDTQDNYDLVLLVDQIGSTIESCTGEKPVLR
jgi:hypothetical protein